MPLLNFPQKFKRRALRHLAYHNESLTRKRIGQARIATILSPSNRDWWGGCVLSEARSRNAFVVFSESRRDIG
jgi:hypothetical protein